ncbi:hypothetical protein D4R51_01155 [bacterium]|nr:MAG: hypothetical protein D4R51_01155 [bacterium]
MSNINFEELMKKVAELKKSGKFDLSLDEDLSIAVMNLVSLEEHFFFTAEKTKKDEYFDLLRETREIRKEMLGRLIDKHEGETWCVSKHLLAASMRLMEVGTKLEGAGKRGEAKKMFDDAYKLYALFWSLRLKLVNTEGLKSKENEKSFDAAQDKPWSYEDIVDKLVDCCKE